MFNSVQGFQKTARDICKFILMSSFHTSSQEFLKCTLTLNPVVSPLADKVFTMCNFANDALK